MKRIKTTLASLLFGAVASVGLADKINTKINNLGFEITEIGVANSDYETSVPRIYKEKVIWPGCNTTGCGIINYDLITNKMKLIDTSKRSSSLAIYKETIVWQGSGEHNTSIDIYMWDPVNGERQIISSTDNQSFPDIYDNKVIWINGKQRRWNISPTGFFEDLRIMMTTLTRSITTETPQEPIASKKLVILGCTIVLGVLGVGAFLFRKKRISES